MTVAGLSDLPLFDYTAAYFNSNALLGKTHGKPNSVPCKKSGPDLEVRKKTDASKNEEQFVL